MKTANLPAMQSEINDMKEPFIHPGLLWKEGRQHSCLFSLFLVLILQPFGLPVFIQAFGLIANVSAPGFNPWVWSVTNVIRDGASNMEGLAIVAAVLLAAFIVAGERGRGLNFLVTTPVSRRQIITAKWVTGSLTILLAMLLLFAYMSAIHILYPTDIAMNQIFSWAGRTTAALLCLFSLALLSASLCTSVLYSALLTALFLMLPVMLCFIIVLPANKYTFLSSHQIAQISCWLSYGNIINYIMNEGWMGEGVTPALILIIPLLLFAALLFFLLAVRAFENNPLERNGEVLLKGYFKGIGRWIIVCLLSPLYATKLADNINWFIIYTIFLAIGIYLGLGWLWRVMAWLGLLKQSDI